MLLVIDVGNTNMVIGVYAGQDLKASWRLRTERNSTVDELGVLVSSLFRACEIPIETIQHTIVSCVVPPLVNSLHGFCQQYLKKTPQWVNAKSYPRMPIQYANPEEVGADRIVNAVGAYDK
jgi:type III pantothenate kinase